MAESLAVGRGGGLAMLDHAYLLAHLDYRASRTARPITGTDVFAKRDEQAVDGDPVLLR